MEWFRRELQRNPLLMLADFGTHHGFDGKALESHSTGNEIPAKGEDADARWGKHEYHYTDHKGRPQKGVICA